MQRVVLARILNTLPVLLIVSLVSFVLLHLAPGDPVSMYMSNDMSTANPADVARVRKAMGLDEPLPLQYALWLGHALQGDLGFSLSTKRPVLAVILEVLPNSLLLTSLSLGLAVLVGLGLGLLTALRQNSRLDYIVTTLAFVGYSIPSFYLALLLLYALSFYFKLLPSSGMFSLRAGNTPPPIDLLQHLVMPVIAGTLVQLVVWVRFQRNSLVEVMSQDYLRTARAKGLAERIVILRHAWRNSLIPIATQLGLSFSYLIGGSFIIETIFAWPGMGRLGIESIQYRDYPVSMGILLLSSAMIVLGNLLADIAYGILDPKITFEWKALS
jgi:peptide/nickel transport system permease protein